MNRILEPVGDVPGEIVRRSITDGAAWFVGWLQRRDAYTADIATEQLVEALEAVAAELRGEATHESTAHTRGLLLAAAVLIDTAGGVRVGDRLPAA